MRVYNNGYYSTKKSSFSNYIDFDVAEAKTDNSFDEVSAIVYQDQDDGIKEISVISLQDFICPQQKSLKSFKSLTKSGSSRISTKSTKLIKSYFSIENQRIDTPRGMKGSLDRKKPDGRQYIERFVIQEKIKKEFEAISQSVLFSQMGSLPSASIKIACKKNRVAMLVFWSVALINNKHTSICNIQVAPIINCSQHPLEILVGIAEFIADTITNQFQCYSGELYNSRNPSEAIELFTKLSQFIMHKKNEMVTILSGKMNGLATKNVYTIAIQKSLQLSQVTPGRSLDYLDLYLEVDKREAQAVNQVKSDISIWDTNNMKENCCPICFDTFDGNQMHLTACGHEACSSCWRQLIHSAVSSGEAGIKCPYFQCSHTLGICDIAHILFKKVDAKCDILSETKVLMNLIRFQIEQYLFTNSNQGIKTEKNASFRFCVTPSCNRIFSFPKNINKEKRQLPKINGSFIHLCSCGASICADCKHEGPSHLGLTCNEYKKLRKEVDSGRMDAEFKSFRWMKKNAHPCPKCKFPIIKNEGCNHIMCAKCKYYFCWICKGPGHHCSSYHCKRIRNFKELNDMREVIDGKTPDLEEIKQLKYFDLAERAYHELLKEGALVDDQDKNIALKVQLRLCLVWTQAYLASHLGSNKFSTSKLKDSIASLEQILYSITMKKDDHLERMSRFFEKGHREVLMTPSSTKKSLTTRKKQSKVEKMRQERHNTLYASKQLSLSDIVAITKLNSMNSKRFKYNANLEMNKAVQQLKRENQRRAKKVTTPYRDLICDKKSAQVSLLNGGAKPMRNTRFSKTLKKDSDNACGKARWKGKYRVKARRIVSLTKLNQTVF